MKLLSPTLVIATGLALISSATPIPGFAQTGSGNVTAEQQSNTKSDYQITRQIRRAIVKDKSLSTRAHNVEIITKQGHVTLKGKVDSTDEKSKVEAAATTVAGTGNVDDQITIAGQS